LPLYFSDGEGEGLDELPLIVYMIGRGVGGRSGAAGRSGIALGSSIGGTGTATGTGGGGNRSSVLSGHFDRYCCSGLENQNPRSGSICGETAELEGSEPIINTPPHLPRHPKGMREKERFWLEERRKRVRGYDRVPSREEPHKLRGSMKTRQECVGTKSWER